VGIRSQVQRLSRPHRGERRARRRRRGQRPLPEGATNGDGHAEEQGDLVTSVVDDHAEVKANGGAESSISLADAHVEAATSEPIHLPPPTKADSPL